jgi:signal transduction histidine kinase
MASRSALALLLVVAALALPAGAWWVAGTRGADLEAERLRNAPRQEAKALADRLAERVSARLILLQDREADRPTLQYQNLYHDPRVASKGNVNVVVPSPLAEGPADPIVRGHFQVEADGAITLPTINPQVPDANFNRDQAGQERLQQELAPVAARCAVAAPVFPAAGAEIEIGGNNWSPPVQVASGQQGAPPQLQEQAKQQQRQTAAPQAQTVQQDAAPVNAPRPNTRVQKLAPGAWAQNVKANDLYNAYKNGAQQAEVVERTVHDEQSKRRGAVELRSGPFVWRRLDLPGGATLAALRWVRWPDRTATQGFLLSRRGLDALCAGTALPAAVVPARGGTGESVTSVVRALESAEGGPWYVRVQVADALAEAQVAAAAVQAAFRRSFALGVSFAALAGLCVVALVWHTERLAQQRAQFAASAAHELRTPLAGLRMYGEMLADGTGDPAKHGTYARRIASEAERLGRVVSNVLEFTRLERGTLRVQPVAGDLSAAVQEEFTRVFDTLQAAGIAAELELPTTPVRARFDRDALSQILHNLLDNAEKYTRGTADRRVRVTVAARDGVPVLTVADNGPGVPEAAQAKLFRAFERTSDPDAPAGLGLGLALVRVLSEAQGGRIACAPAPGGGAAFTLTLQASA